MTFIKMTILSLLAVFGINSCIVSERDKCYEDIRRGDKTGSIQDACIQAALYSNYHGTDTNAIQFRDFYIALCAAEIVESEKCESKSNWTPTVDARM
jgi:hypothetical protein